MYGIIIACILLPLERFYQDNVFRKKSKKGWIARFKERIANKKRTPEEEEKQSTQYRIFQASLAAMLTFFLLLFLVVYLAFSILIPQAVIAKDSVSEWGKNSQTVLKMEKYIQGESDSGSDLRKESTLQTIRKNLRELANENKATLASFAFARGKDIFSLIYGFLMNR